MSIAAKPFRLDPTPPPYQPPKIVIGAIFNCFSLLLCLYGAIFVDGYIEDNYSTYRYFLIILANIAAFHIPFMIISFGSPDTAKTSLIFSLCYVACSIGGAFTVIIWFFATVVAGGGKVKQLGRKMEPIIAVILSISSISNAIGLVALILFFCGLSAKRWFPDEKSFDNVVPTVTKGATTNHNEQS
uniref:Uncharacterized protein n=1 Tax=Plectus sambesii TaxID=2011161 RepID=A0A914VIX1_9BILA